MSVTGIDKVVYGVDDVATCVRYLHDWGLGERKSTADMAVFETLDGSEVEVRQRGDARLPLAFEEGSTLRHVVWGVADEVGLASVSHAISDVDTFAEDDVGVSCLDPNGMHLSFRVSRRRAVAAKGSPTNMIDQIVRKDQRGRVYKRAEPIKIGHVVFFTPDVKAGVQFYEQRLGFVISDCYPDTGYFLRCQPEGGHHNLFLLQTPDRRRGLNHVAFTVRDIHEVFGGGLHMSRCGWRTQIGPGRHPVSSAYFWYVQNPAGGLAEYYADEDYCTADWQAGSWERTPANFAEWAIEGGIDGNTRRQTKGPA